MEVVFKCHECWHYNRENEGEGKKYKECEWRDLTGAVNHITNTQHEVTAEIEPDYNEE